MSAAGACTGPLPDLVEIRPEASLRHDGATADDVLRDAATYGAQWRMAAVADDGRTIKAITVWCRSPLSQAEPASAAAVRPPATPVLVGMRTECRRGRREIQQQRNPTRRTTMRGKIHRHGVLGKGCVVRVRVRIALALCVALFLGGPATVPAQAALSSRESTEWDFLNKLNERRTSAGLPAVRMATALREIARGWSENLATTVPCALRHTPGLDAVVDRAIGSEDWLRVGENVGCGPSVKGIDDALFASEGHRRNILDGAFAYVGVGVVERNGVIFVTFDFLAPTTTTPRLAVDMQPLCSGTGLGYWEVAGDGGAFAYGDAGFYGSAGGMALNVPVVGMAATLTGRGYGKWQATAASSLTATPGSTGRPAEPASTPRWWARPPLPPGAATGKWQATAASSPTATPGSTGRQVEPASTPRSWAWPPLPPGAGTGKWRATAASSPTATPGSTDLRVGWALNVPVVGMAATPTGRGYWEVASDGGIFAYGDARFYGSAGGTRLNAPVVGMAATLTGRGYWEVASDGGIFAYGDARFCGSPVGTPLNSAMVGMAPLVAPPVPSGQVTASSTSVEQAWTPSSTQTNFYFARSGSDVNPCTQAAPCATLKRASDLLLAPGNGLYFQRGGSWAGTLTLAESGESGNNVIVGAYGTGAQPKITSATDSCIRIDGNWVTLDNLETSSCGYAGVRVAGDRVIVKYMTSALNVVGIFITSTADLGVYERNTLRDNNRMNVNTPSPANDDSGAFGFLVQGDSNELKNNVITGSDAFSYDYGRDGCAIEIFGASGTNAHDNTATSNNCFVELGKPATDPSSANNRFTYNVISSSERGTQSPKEGRPSHGPPATRQRWSDRCGRPPASLMRIARTSRRTISAGQETGS